MQLDPRKLAREYRPSMPTDVLHLWAKDVVAYLEAASSPSPAPGVASELEAIEGCLNLLDSLRAESGRSVAWGEEDAFRMGEWFEPEELAMISEARTALASLSQPAKGDREGGRGD